MKNVFNFSLPLVVAGLGCGDNLGTSELERPVPEVPVAAHPEASALPASYEFTSRYGSDSSVAYAGQSLRHVLINDLTTYLDGLTRTIDSGATLSGAQLSLGLAFYLTFDVSTGGDLAPALKVVPAAKQTRYRDVAPGGAQLRNKVAGSEPAYDHRDWQTSFVGWPGVATPHGALDAWFAALVAQATARVRGEVAVGPDGQALSEVYLTPAGLDLMQLVQKQLLMSITYAQATDKYLDDATPGAGLLAPNTRDGDKPYTKLEHAWDEGFGYFGAARAYGAMTDAEIAKPGYRDFDGDGQIDLTREVNYGVAVNAAKRDLGAKGTPTDFTRDAMAGFLRGRAIIARAGETLTAAELADLKAARDQAVAAWEAAIAATIVHYINAVLVDMDAFGTSAYKFSTHAKHWSEAKGFALGLQFNPRSKLSADAQAQLNTLLGAAPVLATAEAATQAAYRAGLLEARTLLGAAMGFDVRNLGDDRGQGGW